MGSRRKVKHQKKEGRGPVEAGDGSDSEEKSIVVSNGRRFSSRDIEKRGVGPSGGKGGRDEV